LLEVVALGVGLVIVCTFAFEIASRQVPSSFLPALLYLPLPLVLWAAFRFGVKGATGAILVVAVALIWRTLNGPTLFIADTAEMSVFAIQLFLIGLSIPILLLGASIGEARRAEQEVRESEERMAFAAVAADVCLWHFDHASDQFWITEHGRQMLGVPADRPLTRADMIEAVHHDDREIVGESLDGSSASKRVVDCEFRVVRPDGQMRWFRSRARAHGGDSAAPAQISGTFADVTEQKLAENEIAQQRQEIAHLMRVSMLGELSGGIAHELTQPLSAILSNAEAARILLTRPSFNVAELIDVLDDIIGEDHRAGEVIHRIRGLLTRSEAKFEAVDVNALADASLRLLNAELINRRVKVTLRLADGLPLVDGDSVQLQQVVLNLVMNAADAMNDTPPARRMMTVSSGETSDGGIRLAVSDCGVGLQPAHHERVFQPFFTTKPRGLGLGLSLCRSIIKLHGGVLKLDNNPEGGATAAFSLPQLQMTRAAE
jgi:signal transduction histidine kinase